MKISCLIDNCALEGFESEHGLSFYIEACGKRVLFDMGASGAFIRNARALGIDLAGVDFAVLSHGHYDHGGGLAAFLELNPSAKVYIRRGAFEKHYSHKPGMPLEYIGLDPALEGGGRIVETGESASPCEGFTLVSAADGNELRSSANDVLLGPDAKTPDSFAHEQNLLINEGGRRVLIAGCAHRGIVNIINRVFNMDPVPPRAVFGGFHLAIPGAQDVNEALVDATAEFLLSLPGTEYFTGHCTGLPSYERLRSAMGSRLRYIHAGESVEI